MTQKAPRGRPVSGELDGRLFEAATASIAETQSLHDLSVDALCRRAGASKASFYRRWPDRDAFLLALLASLRDPVPVSDGAGSLRETLVAILDNMLGADTGRTRLVHAALVAEGRRNRALIDRYVAQVVLPRRTALAGRLKAALHAGDLPPVTDLDMLAEMLTAPVLKRMLLADPAEPVAGDFTARLVDQALRSATR